VKKKKRGTIEIDMLGWIILGVILLIIGVVVIIIFKGKGAGAISKIIDLLRFGK